jgi:hypothetical protein
VDRFKFLAMQAAEQVGQHPITSTVGAVAAAIIAVLQSSQEVASTLIALFTSSAAAMTAFLTLRSAWRNRNKKD